MKAKLADRFSKLGCCVLIPTFNNAGTLNAVLDGVLEYTQDVIVVNDGSTDGSLEILVNYPSITLISYENNRGKGFALRSGFKAALEKGYRNVITIDSDGQHSPADLERFLEDAEANPGCLVLGARNMDQEGVPGKSSFGNKFSNFWFWVETGIRMPDTQTGYRLYPIERMGEKRYFTRKFEFEIEVLVRSAWQGIPVRSVPISVYYAQGDERVSHFRPFKDFFRISVLNTVLVALALLFFLPVMIVRNFSYDKFKKLIGKGEPTSKLATAIGFGVFMGIVPIWGWQMITAAFLAHVFRLNKAMVLLASNISFGPMVAVVIYLSFLAGRIFVKEPVNLIFDVSLSLEHIKVAAVQYILGSMLLAISAGLLAGIISYIFLKIRRNSQNKRKSNIE